MDELLIRCNNNLLTLPCCHMDGRVCNCYECLRSGFYEMPDSYDCPKKMNYYVLNYGPSYASEIYHYLTNSQILESLDSASQVRILSLGCGFAPDLIAMSKYIADRHFSVQIDYHGIDQSHNWGSCRYSTTGATFEIGDATTSLNMAGYDLIFIVKLFSTLYKNGLYNIFIQSLTSAVQNTLRDGGIVVFNDVNSCNMGRGILHTSIQQIFRSHRDFYFGERQSWTPGDWIQMPQNNIVFRIPDGLRIIPLNEIRKTVFFECRK